jgi:hypothetical protein
MAPWRLRGAVSALALVLFTLLAASAHAAVGTPINISASGENPNVTLDAAGDAHIAYTGRGVDSKLLFYCRIPAGGNACSPSTQINAPGDSLTIPVAVNDGGTIKVVSYRYGLTGGPFAQVLLFTSTDGGNTFDNGVSTGAITGPHDIVQGPGNAVSFIDSASICGTCFQRIPLDGSPPSAQVSMSPDGSHPYQGVIGFIDANTPLTVFAAGGGAGQFRRYTGTGDIGDPNNWTPAVDIGPGDWMRLASGPSGLFLVEQNDLSGPDMQVRKFDGTTFGSRTTITSGARADAAVQDGLGRLHVVASKYSPGPTGAAFFYGSSDNGTSWDREEVDFPGLPSTMRMAMRGDDHFGMAVGVYASGPSGGIFASRVGPSAAVPTTARFVDATVVSGTVLIQVPPSKQFVRLRSGDVIPVGSVVDATNGRVRITIAQPNGTLQATDFFQGVFQVRQAKNGLATMVLRGGSFGKCGRAAAVHSAKSKKVVRQLWGAGKGKFQTKGRYAAASIRGTTWDTIDRCDGTLIRVTQGSVTVRDLKKKRNIVVTKGRSYLAKA